MKDHRLAVGRVFLLAALLALLPTPVASQGDSATVQVVRVIDGDRDSSDAREVNALVRRTRSQRTRILRIVLSRPHREGLGRC